MAPPQLPMHEFCCPLQELIHEPYIPEQLLMQEGLPMQLDMHELCWEEQPAAQEP